MPRVNEGCAADGAGAGRAASRGTAMEGAREREIDRWCGVVAARGGPSQLSASRPTTLPEPSVPASQAPMLPLPEALLRAFDTNDRINQYLLESLSDAAWTAHPPGGKGRTIAAIAAHMHNVRVMWLKAAKWADVP